MKWLAWLSVVYIFFFIDSRIKLSTEWGNKGERTHVCGMPTQTHTRTTWPKFSNYAPICYCWVCSTYYVQSFSWSAISFSLETHNVLSIFYLMICIYMYEKKKRKKTTKNKWFVSKNSWNQCVARPSIPLTKHNGCAFGTSQTNILNTRSEKSIFFHSLLEMKERTPSNLAPSTHRTSHAPSRPTCIRIFTELMFEQTTVNI